MTILDELYGVGWAIRPEALAAICRIVDRQELDPETIARAMHHSQLAQRDALAQLARPYAVERWPGASIEGAATLTRRGAVAVLPIVGPIVRYASLFSAVSGATSVQTLARDFTVALDHPAIEAILLAVDSPGGETNGIAELADIIYAARIIKPVWAYVSDLGASAGYWLASAADQVVLAETAAVGSIGVVAAVKDPNGSKSHDIEFVSSVSPNKRADPTTESGRTQLQGLVDTLGEIFVGAVARHRGTTPETVIRDYGAGGLLVGSQAVAAGMADRLGSFESTLDELRAHLAAADPEPPEAEDQAAPVIKKGRSMRSTLRDRFARFVASLDPPDAEALADALETPAKQAQAPGYAGPRPLDGGGGGTPEPDVDAVDVRGAARPKPKPEPEPEPEPAPVPAPSAIREEAPMAQTRPTDPAHHHTLTTAGGYPMIDADEAVPPAIANRLAALEAENARLHAEKIQQAAEAFAQDQVRAFKATAAQVDVIVALHAALASDDERYKALIRADGSRVLRTTLLANFFASQPDRSVLGQEMLSAAGGQVIYDRATASRPDLDAPATAEQLVAYLEQTALGRATLGDLKSTATNGHGR